MVWKLETALSTIAIGQITHITKIMQWTSANDLNPFSLETSEHLEGKIMQW